MSSGINSAAIATTSTTLTAPQPGMARDGKRKRTCVRTTKIRGKVRACNRKVIWRISYIGPMCNSHFEDYLTKHTVDPADITRLSANERDFVTKAEPGKGYSRKRKKA